VLQIHTGIHGTTPIFWGQGNHYAYCGFVVDDRGSCEAWGTCSSSTGLCTAVSSLL